MAMKKADVLDHFGGVTKTAIALGINKATVSPLPSAPTDAE